MTYWEVTGGFPKLVIIMLKLLSKSYYPYIFLQTKGVRARSSLKPDVATVIKKQWNLMNEDMSAVLGATGQLESVGHKAIIYFYKNFNEDYKYWCHIVICSSKLHDYWMNSIPLVNWKILYNFPVVILPLQVENCRRSIICDYQSNKYLSFQWITIIVPYWFPLKQW